MGAWALKNYSLISPPSRDLVHLSPYKQIIIVNSVTNTAFVLTLYAVTIVTYKYNGSLECSVLAAKTTLQNARSSPHTILGDFRV